MQNHAKKMIAPVVTTLLMILYYIAYFGFLIALLPVGWKIALGILLLAFTGVTIYVCVERIREIRKGEEDDLSQY